ncbi:hypothetical protein LUZ60_017728 [Juncus effusus]|nr:hypothetical protein LUZ60_017728 [Juncus effusus]
MILEGGEMGQPIGGYFIRRVISPQVKLRLLTSPASNTKRRIRSTTYNHNNENENGNSAAGHVAGQYNENENSVAGQSGSQRKRRSPLPEWYPRAPLRDITAICKAIEKRNLLKDDDVAPQRLTLSPAKHQTPIATNQIKPSFKSDPTVLDFLTPIKILYTPEMEEYEKKLTESIEKLERIVKRNLRREKKMKSNTACVSKREVRVRTLMSMR